MSIITGYYVSPVGKSKDYWCLDCFEEAPLDRSQDKVIPVETNQFQFGGGGGECLVCGEVDVLSYEAKEIAEEKREKGEHPEQKD